MTPIPAYRASVSAAAASQIRSSVECSSSPLPTDRMASSNCGTRTASSAESPGADDGDRGARRLTYPRA